MDFCFRQNNHYQCSNNISCSMLSCIFQNIQYQFSNKFIIQIAESVLMQQQIFHTSTSMHFLTMAALYRILLSGPLPHTNLQIHLLFFNQKLGILQTDFNQSYHYATIPILSILYQNPATPF